MEGGYGGRPRLAWMYGVKLALGQQRDGGGSDEERKIMSDKER